MHKVIGGILYNQHRSRIERIKRIQCLFLAAPAGRLQLARSNGTGTSSRPNCGVPRKLSTTVCIVAHYIRVYRRVGEGQYVRASLQRGTQVRLYLVLEGTAQGTLASYTASISLLTGAGEIPMIYQREPCQGCAT